MSNSNWFRSDNVISKFTRIIVAVLLFILVCVVVGKYTPFLPVLKKVIRLLNPVFYGIVLAYLLTPVYNTLYGWARKLKINHLISKVLSIALSVLMAMFLVYAFFALLVPSLYENIQNFVKNIPIYSANFQNFMDEFLRRNPTINNYANQFYNEAYLTVQAWINSKIVPNLNDAETTIRWLRDTVFPNLSSLFIGVSSVIKWVILFLKDLLIGLIVAVYMLATKDYLAAQCKKLTYSVFHKERAEFLIREVRMDHKIFGGFISGKILDSFIVAIITFVVLSIMRMPYTVIVTVIIGVTNIIPFFGPLIGAIPTTALILFIDPIKALYFVIYVIVIQQIDGNIIGPKILGDKVGLPGLGILIAVILFGGLFGVFGMVVGVPITAVLYSMLKRYSAYLLKMKDLPSDTSKYKGEFVEVEELIPSVQNEMENSTEEQDPVPENTVKVVSEKNTEE